MLPTSKNQFYIQLGVALVIGLLLGGAGRGLKGYMASRGVDKQGYQGVFLDNNQQYFGHLKGVGTHNPYLTDVYYVKTEPAEAGQQPRFNLIKLGKELHGPEDVVYLNWSKILFWQNLKKDSQIVQGIAKEKANRGNPPPAVTPPPAPSN